MNAIVIAIMAGCILSECSTPVASEQEVAICSKSPLWEYVNAEPIRSVQKKEIRDQYPFPETALVNAAILGRRDLLAELISSKNLLLRDGPDALYVSASMGRLDVMQLLIRAGVQPNALSRNAIPALYGAVEGGCVDAYSYLIESGANINFRGSSKFGLVQFAVGEAEYGLASTIIKSGYISGIEEQRSIRDVLLKRNRLDVFERLYPEL